MIYTLWNGSGNSCLTRCKSVSPMVSKPWSSITTMPHGIKVQCRAQCKHQAVGFRPGREFSQAPSKDPIKSHKGPNQR